MDGVLLTGGLASRLGPITRVTNKHLLPVYDKPMIYYGIELLRELGCERVVIILGGNSVGDIVNLVRDGSSFGVEVVYKFQDKPLGIAHALALAQDIIDTEVYKAKKFLVLLGDNLYGNTEGLKENIKAWSDKDWNHDVDISFSVFLARSDHPHDYGQPVFKPDGTVEKFVEKKKDVGHDQIVTGLYGLNCMAFEIIRKQHASGRGEFEITDTLSAWPFVIPYSYEGFWSDCGTPEGLVEASKYMREKDRNEDTS